MNKDVERFYQYRVIGVINLWNRLFRIRIVANHVGKLTATHTKNEKRKQTDYLGYSINLASRLLEVERRKPCICHQGVKEILNGKKIAGYELAFAKIKRPDSCPRGVDAEDLDDLWSFGRSGKETLSL